MEPLVERALPGLHSSLISHLPAIEKDAAILDLGCGTGAWLQRLSGAGFTNLHGVDADVDQFDCASAKALKGNLDEDRLPLGKQKFGLITAIEVIEHLENPGRIYFHIAKYLADDGYALITTPNIHSLISRLRHLATGKLGQFDEKADKTHIAPLLMVGMERVVPRHGLAVVKTWGYPEKGSLMYRRSLQFVSKALSLVLPDPLPGDILCVQLKRIPGD